ncbi:MAG: DUF2892 domain-containing protein [Furfurilactobacillus sp.]|jgi:hypothetical protein|uniref:DUF2892 domain-containing protein n=1 Tax=Furfurilactobacillus milii TaxID=2888272 RepID=A0ABT6DC35_9LACO|nr:MULTISPECIES: DUF2892 domain-containing protein [Furfurilactobacillus]QLE66090.1 hypothetical protein LROSL2_0738 [Furfurilactobacillus rossiae]MCF6160811.1 DUF2892 domain-containing protein [Furfurilactobacillus milii]MCF6162995.1 DUF2892 domain-containing protein [Furfurilactobacillus milii]MCF6419704.1 DUF2892 domain-containing protein [Furfurilactobacillus milii]MCH4012608.1 DUF2892 domain-containing protein [Furfurilactobacillus sp.]
MSENQNDTANKSFSVSLVAPWVKGNMFVDNDFFHVDIPNTVLFGMVPAGRQRDTSPLNTISNVYTSNSYKLGRIFLGGLIALGGIASIGSSAVTGIILILLGFAILGSGILTTFAYERSGVEKQVSLPFFEANHSKELEQQLTEALSAFQSSRNVTANTQQIIEAMNKQHEK